MCRLSFSVYIGKRYATYHYVAWLHGAHINNLIYVCMQRHSNLPHLINGIMKKLWGWCFLWLFQFFLLLFLCFLLVVRLSSAPDTTPFRRGHAFRESKIRILFNTIKMSVRIIKLFMYCSAITAHRKNDKCMKCKVIIGSAYMNVRFLYWKCFQLFFEVFFVVVIVGLVCIIDH